MKTITFAVPCYNSADYMDACIESILKCGDDIEVVIVERRVHEGRHAGEGGRMGSGAAPDVVQARCTRRTAGTARP